MTQVWPLDGEKGGGGDEKGGEGVCGTREGRVGKWLGLEEGYSATTQARAQASTVSGLPPPSLRAHIMGPKHKTDAASRRPARASRLRGRPLGACGRPQKMHATYLIPAARCSATAISGAAGPSVGMAPGPGRTEWQTIPARGLALPAHRSRSPSAVAERCDRGRAVWPRLRRRSAPRRRMRVGMVSNSPKGLVEAGDHGNATWPTARGSLATHLVYIMMRESSAPAMASPPPHPSSLDIFTPATSSSFASRHEAVDHARRRLPGLRLGEPVGHIRLPPGELETSGGQRMN